MCGRTRTHLTQGALRAAKSLAKHIRGRDLQTLPLHSNCYQISQLFSTKLFLFALFPLHLHIKRTIETSRRRRRRRRWRRDERRGGRERERDPGARPRTPVLMGIISFYLRQLSLHSILISEQRSTVPSKENVCVWKTPSRKQDKARDTYACRLSRPTSALFLEG